MRIYTAETIASISSHCYSDRGLQGTLVNWTCSVCGRVVQDVDVKNKNKFVFYIYTHFRSFRNLTQLRTVFKENFKDLIYIRLLGCQILTLNVLNVVYNWLIKVSSSRLRNKVSYSWCAPMYEKCRLLRHIRWLAIISI